LALLSFFKLHLLGAVPTLVDGRPDLFDDVDPASDPESVEDQDLVDDPDP